MTARDAAGTLNVMLPIPSRDVAKGAHAHHWTTRKVYTAHRSDAKYAILDCVEPPGARYEWPAAWLDVTWCYSRGRPPDDDGAIARISPYRDGAQDAHLVTDDRYMTQRSMTFARVNQGEECVILVFTERILTGPDAGAGGRAGGE